MRKFLGRTVAIAVLAAAGVAFAQAPSLASPGTGDGGAGPGLRIVQRVGAGTVEVPLPTDSKTEWLAKYSTDTRNELAASGTLTSRGSAAGPAGSASFTAYGTTNYSTGCGLLSCTATFSANHAEFSWLGSNPFNANQINGSMKWWLSGVNVSVNIPPSAGFSASGNALIWNPGDVTQTWRQVLNYQAGVKLNATVISSTHFTDQADFLLGSTWYHVQGN